jgi:cephalosporin-C deacetylase
MKIKDFTKQLHKLMLIAPVALVILLHNGAFAQTANDDNEQGDVSTVLTPHSSDAIFSTNASYTFSIKNTFNKTESGKVSYVVMDQFNKKLLIDSIPVNIGRNSTENLNVSIPSFKSGFYKINFMINVSDYDDTTRRVFGIRADEIRSKYPKPADFDQFWENTKAELEAIKPDFQMVEKPDSEQYGEKVYLISFKSLDNMTIRGWMTIPGDQPKGKKFPVLMILPGYQANTKPLQGPNTEMCFISVDVRGQGMNRPDMEMKREDYIVSHIEDKNKYIMRGIIMDCIRYVDFVCSRPELDHSRIAVTGGSMGGYMSLTTAALDHRVSLCAPQNPFLSDIYNMDHGAVQWPMQRMRDYASIKPGLTFDKILNNLQYFDTKNFADMIQCPVLLGIGLLDPFVPPNNSFAVYNNIHSEKKIIVFKDLGHEVGKKYDTYEELWMRDKFALF